MILLPLICLICCRIPVDYVSKLRTTITKCVTMIRILFAYRDRLSGDNNALRSRKLHFLFHSPGYIEAYGSLLGMDTETFECFMKQCAKNPYRSGQKRKTNIPTGLMTSVNALCVCFANNTVIA